MDDYKTVGLASAKRAVVFIDGQNLFRSAKDAGFCIDPDYDVVLLAGEICRRYAWECSAVRFYTGVHDSRVKPRLFQAWQRKLSRMRASGVETTTRPLRYSPDRSIAREKGIDVRLALDVVRLGRLNHYDVGVIVSQDQDLHEAVLEMREIAIQQRRWIKMVSTYVERSGAFQRGIDGTDWIKIDRPLYEMARESTPFY